MKQNSAHIRIKIAVGLWVLVLFLAALYILRLFLLPFALGGLIALLIQPTVNHAEGRYNLSRNTSIGVVFGIFAVAFLLVGYYVVPKIVQEFRQLQGDRAQFVMSITERYQQLKLKVKKQSPQLHSAVPWKDFEKSWLKPEEWLSKGQFESIWYRVTHGLEWLFSVLVLSPLVAFFILKDGALLKHWAMHFVPNRYFEMVMELLYNINNQIVAFVRGQFWDSSINALLLSVALTLVGLPYAILVGLFAGIANAVPVVGPILAGSVSVLIAILTGSVNPWVVFIVFLLIHIIDVTIIYPMCVGHSLRLHEAVVIVGVFSGGYIGGALGMLVAVPLIGIIVRSTEIVFRTLRGYRIL